MSAPDFLDLPLPTSVSGVTILLPVVTETDALDETVRMLHEVADADIDEILLLICARTSDESRARCHAAAELFGDRAQIHEQLRPGLGGAMREGFSRAIGSHTVMMASDLETDPALVATMIAAARLDSGAIVTASRWASGGGFSGYGAHRVAMNRAFQALTALLYRADLSDATFGYRLFPTELMQAIVWEGERHEFLLETILKPLRLGVRVVEVPTQWSARSDGTSQNSLRTQLRYVPLLLRTRRMPLRSILKVEATSR